ncbi:Hexokinase-2 [Schizosaccharomyces pombe]|uniref:Hexokinase-2 n=1 Tax=Schizosaccharomyces pombe (strain 972 / ATCC 24843) TaxID=284812 RepID=HXK2_SCHPO|nr:hexokinase 2 [Schizosaccharomyces pombe]P50521.1 RecName: Full=Hexokinase-2 [Schizosaccharomyces pombe 972h-]CAA63488.1 hexokinase 2 [Schizosaccharomyces pombe]CAB11054.1 hexokinase 2 [Schizosaccharomyces pombe]|eukprot:NP_593865.1 hexokinase 2 [Schizosaccharomyces pombe]
MEANFQQAVKKLVNDFEYPTESLREAVKEFDELRQKGLQKNGEVLAMAPAFISTLPTGAETGDFLALDFGGTNLRVCWIQLLGDGKYEMKHSKSVLPRECVRNESVKPIIDFMSDHVELFIKEHFPSKFGCPEEEYLPMGFTFSYPANQVSITESYLLRWTKGLNIPEAINKDFAQFLTEGFKARNLPIRIEAVINDTVGTLVTRAYTSKESDTFMGIIFGTGTNGAYVEQMNQIPKLAGKCTGDHMLINMEWGATDFSCLHSTRYDLLLDHDTPNAGRQIFEKRVGGMYLGELFRRALFHLIKVYNFNEGIFPPSITDAWSLETSVLSRMMVERSAENVRNVLSTFKFRFRSDEEALYLWDAAHAIGRRAARMSAVPIASLYLSTGRAGKKSDVGVDGSLVEHYPHFVDMLREALRELIGDNEKLISIGIAKDGSGIGAALCALQAVKEKKGLA